MKKIFSFALVALALASCKNAEDVAQSEPIKDTTLTVAISGAGFTSTRAATGEEDVNSLYVYVFNDQKVCEKIIPFTKGFSDEGLTGGEGGKQFRMATTTGGKYFLVSGNVELKAGNAPITVDATKLDDVLSTELTVEGTGDKANSLSGSFPMIGYKYVYVSEDSGTTNVSIEIERLWAKVEVIKSSGFEGTVKAIANVASITDVVYELRNISKAYKYTNTNIETPTEASNGVMKAIHTPIYPVLSASYLNKYWKLSASVNISAGTAFGTTTVYIPENQVKLSTKDNTPTMNSVTYARVCIKVAPQSVFNGRVMENYSSGDIVLAYKDGTVKKDASSNPIWYKSAAIAASAVPGCVPYVYKDGCMYFRVDLKDSNRTKIYNNTYDQVSVNSQEYQKYNVIRNHYYKIALSGIKSFDTVLPATSADYLDGINDEMPLGATTLLTNITVAPWKEININTTL